MATVLDDDEASTPLSLLLMVMVMMMMARMDVMAIASGAIVAFSIEH